MDVNPKYYKKGTVECIDAIESAIYGLDGRSGFLAGQVIKYIYRFHDKNGVEDLEKARWYLDRLIAFELDFLSRAKNG